MRCSTVVGYMNIMTENSQRVLPVRVAENDLNRIKSNNYKDERE